MFQYIGTTVRATIDAPAPALWSIVSDFTRHPELAGSGQVVTVEQVTPGPIRQGARFQANQRIGTVNYRTESTVVVYEPPHRLAWRIGFPGTPPFAQVWQFALIPYAERTQVEHSVALPYVIPQLWPFTMAIQAITQAEAQAMTPTLKNLAKLAGADAPDSIETRLEPAASAAAELPSPLLQGSLWIAGPALLGALVVRRQRQS